MTTPTGMIVEVDSTKPLSRQMTSELLEEDNDIDSFFANHTIRNIRQMVMSPVKNREDTIIGGKVGPKNGVFTRRQRLNNMLKMNGEFTRPDYQKYMLDMFGVKVEKYISHDDIQYAVKCKRIENIGNLGRLKKYKVVDSTDIDETLYKTLLKDRKAMIGILH